MSIYYNPKRTRNIYGKNTSQPFKLSRSKIELFVNCPRCFFLDRKLGIGRPPGFPFNLNNAVDTLLKREFDTYRVRGIKHPLMEGIDAIPVHHAFLEKWRENFVGIQFLHKPTNLLLFGAIDDLWQNSLGEYIVVDYKATSKDGKILALDQDWHISYKRQLEIYQWLLRSRGYKVSNVGYWVYANGDSGRERFDTRLDFDMTLIKYEGNSEWVEGVVYDIWKCLEGETIPERSGDCDYCRYREAVSEVENSKVVERKV